MNQRVQSIAWRILVVEDDEVDALLFERLLTASGQRFEATVRASIRDAISWLEEHEADVVLLDQSLPDGRGVEGISEIRRHIPHIPIVMMTGLNDEDMASKAVDSGAVDYLVKGESDPSTLANAIRRAIDH
ncbi:MAG: response regulator [Planctomycetota bacterium]